MNDITWKSKVSFGKYKGHELLSVWIKDKGYFKWAIENEVNKPEIEFVKNEMTKTEKRQMKLEY